MFLQRPVSNFFWERNFVQYACMGLPDLMTLEQFIYIYNGAQPISGRTLEASFHHEHTRRSLSI